MKRTIFLFLTLVCGTLAFSQKAETIESIVANRHETEWYAAQAEAWQKKVDTNLQDQWAWRNLFRATYYYDQFTNGWGIINDETRTADVLRKMEATLPDSFVLNLCKGSFCLSTDEAAKRGDNIHRAIELMPEDICPEDLEYLATRLWIVDPENPRVKELYTKTYQNKYFPTRIMHFNYNMLQCLPSNALYFSNGDLDTVPMKVLQDALGERTDVIIINNCFLHATPFMEALYKKLNIEPLTLNVQDYGKYGEEWLQHYESDIIMYIIHESKRPAFLSPTNSLTTVLDKDSIYNEGLVLKYSPKPYDNFAVAMHNVKEVYNLEYLAEPDLVYDSWETSEQMDLNHVTLLANLISKFRKKGDEAQAKRLYDILSKCVERCTVAHKNTDYPEERKAYYDNLLKEQLQ